MRRLLMLTTALPLGFTLSGCDNSKAATETNLARAIQGYEKEHPGDLCGDFYGVKLSPVGTDFDPDTVEKSGLGAYETLQRLGYVTVEKFQPPLLGAEPVLQVKPTQKFNDEIGIAAGDRVHSCYGTFTFKNVKEIVEHTNSAEVKAAVNQQTTAAWTKNPELVQLFDFKAPASEGTRTYFMVLEGNNWMVKAVRP
ncbi:hypothetical protein E5F05_04325 (plasmid) [Deinococcus metallilatus]|uniref:Lipoprotein n=1 Tax=Deinococcus metallilatus TaxID=1211322 RepID=A0AAJ5K6D5_9DEIO|nr:hypothetical protein [Deinococcus metallilatus]MBB5293835.1 hypothetical protein [Deinococcus metallilatus]QBY07213.1 hypothetical protein E5F05_04325 [Deinococcus metallilatus]RXJ14685.1 hypothetical protein ERJ73_03055 [Deinococcus metallilatus]TLK30805.1 hypothetical protein FCS05_03370 [Deinococcus metallilatus]GMA17766.1 hypothetical protein GCM10025871_40970 [Deinococcus metallilatus]